MPPTPKPAGLRQRRNKASTKATLYVLDPDELFVPPTLPGDRKWHKRTVEHWNAVWMSPMAPEFDLSADYRGLVMLAEMWDDYYALADSDLDIEKKARLRTNLMAQIIRNEQRFGLTPLDRRRLQWEIDRGDESEERTQKRRESRRPRPVEQGAEDPRQMLA